MATVRDYMYSEWWASTYNRYNFQDPSNKNYGHFPFAARHRPLTIDSNPEYTIELDRHDSGANSYNIGAVGAYVRHTNLNQRIDQCSDYTGAPNQCATKILGKRNTFSGNPTYDRVGL